MAGDLGSRSRGSAGPEAEPPIQVSVCRSCPGKFVFLESGNTDGWIATDLTVELTR